MQGFASPAACKLHTTLVLWQQAPDFSTDAGNSALIAANEISATPESPRAEQQKRDFSSYPIGSPGR